MATFFPILSNWLFSIHRSIWHLIAWSTDSIVLTHTCVCVYIYIYIYIYIYMVSFITCDFNSSVHVSVITVVTRECQISCSIRTAWWGTGNFAEGSKGEWKTNAFRPSGGGWFSKSCSKGTRYTFDSSWTSEDISSSLVHLVRHCLLPHAFEGYLYYISSSVTILTELSHLYWVIVWGREMPTFSSFWFRIVMKGSSNL